MRDYKIKYRTFDQLLDSVMDDFSTYDKNSLIEPSQLIKIAKKINKQLMHRITKTKQCMLQFDNYVAKLPLDFLNPNFALYANEYITTQPEIQGTHRESKPITCDKITPDKEIVFTECGNIFEIVETRKELTYRYKISSKVSIVDKKDTFKNIYGIVGELKGEFIKMNVESGYLYLNYEGILEDEEGNLLVLDHELVNDYYEYALKRRILENIMMGGEEANMVNKMSIIESRFRESGREALSVANMFDFSEIEETLEINRKAAFKRFYSIFI